MPVGVSVKLGGRLFFMARPTPWWCGPPVGYPFQKKGITLAFFLKGTLVQKSCLTQGSDVNIIASELSSNQRSSSLWPVRVVVQESSDIQIFGELVHFLFFDRSSGMPG